MLNQAHAAQAALRSHRDTSLQLSVCMDVCLFLADKTARDAVARSALSPGFTSLQAHRLYEVSRQAAFASIGTGFIHGGLCSREISLSEAVKNGWLIPPKYKSP